MLTSVVQLSFHDQISWRNTQLCYPVTHICICLRVSYSKLRMNETKNILKRTSAEKRMHMGWTIWNTSHDSLIWMDTVSPVVSLLYAHAWLLTILSRVPDTPCSSAMQSSWFPTLNDVTASCVDGLHMVRSRTVSWLSCSLQTAQLWVCEPRSSIPSISGVSWRRCWTTCTLQNPYIMRQT